MKEWVVIHKIKALHDNGDGLSIRQIGKELGISRNTVRKYLRMDEAAVSNCLNEPSRVKKLDEYKDYIVSLLNRYPNLSAVKIARKLNKNFGETGVSGRSLRRYVHSIKKEFLSPSIRHYEPILDSAPGLQCQIDPGEIRGLLIGGKECILYFVVFTLSFSRLMYVGLSFRPLNTQSFIQLHDEAFRYFGGIPEECLYDQTKMVVISEEFRELKINQRFYEYATEAGFRIHACAAGDPESKGKVEAGVKYVKNDCLYGDSFETKSSVHSHVLEWLEDVANSRIHGTTGKIPHNHFETDEKQHLSKYLTPDCCSEQNPACESRKADKTGLVSWKANKYSVPMAYQRRLVRVQEDTENIYIKDIETNNIIAQHSLCREKGKIIKNNNHYRDHEQRIKDLEQKIVSIAGEENGAALCRHLKDTEPRIYKDQLVAVEKILFDFNSIDDDLLQHLCQKPSMTASRLKNYLEADQKAKMKGRSSSMPSDISSEKLDLRAYAAIIGQPVGGQEVTHEHA